MRIDYDFIRTMLLTLEEKLDGTHNFTVLQIAPMFPTIDKETVVYHLKFLHDSRFLESANGYIIDITPLGRAYLENVRNDSVWYEVKDKIHPLGTVAMSVASSIASSIVCNKLGL